MIQRGQWVCSSFAAVALSFALAGCGEKVVEKPAPVATSGVCGEFHDKAYYQASPAEAKARVNKCGAYVMGGGTLTKAEQQDLDAATRADHEHNNPVYHRDETKPRFQG
ncbi:hypothetical protein DBB29_12310 [Pandoraea cepalis]|uniref:Lipoprotein n=1 Tax=Pandoraea cepalis TaxID=2508294 RepID=A0AAW7MH46_9BURK|nr:hypothetical protein [Pandoraea cepalis]MDN4578898.1 hypothetical protein [Pandoraea cepalis]